ncbi:MAG: hypothetical protein ACJA02_001176, partial [Myxococcota bacterium]
AGVIAASMSVSRTVISGSEEKITKERMEVVYDAIKNYVSIHKRLPCPASLQAAKGSENYGVEAPDNGSCDDLSDGLNLVYGMIPIDVLNLNADMAEDGFETKFSYVVDKRFTRTNTGVNDILDGGFELTKSALSENDDPDSENLFGLTVSASGSNLLPNNNGIFALISHGANKFGGYPANSKTQNDGGNVDELENIDFDGIFISSSNESDFDDIVIFKTKAQLVRNADLKYIMCNSDEADNSYSSSWENADYGTVSCASAGSDLFYTRNCSKYGNWGSTNIDTKECNRTIPDCIVSSSANLNSSVKSNNYTQEVAVGSPVSVVCRSGYSGSPAATCSSGGTPGTVTVTSNCSLNQCSGNFNAYGYQNVTTYGSQNYPATVTCKPGYYASNNVNYSTVFCNPGVNPTFDNPTTCNQGCTGTPHISAFNGVTGSTDTGQGYFYWKTNINHCSIQVFKTSDYVFPGYWPSNYTANPLFHGATIDSCRYSSVNHLGCNGSGFTHFTYSRLRLTCTNGVYSVSTVNQGATACDGTASNWSTNLSFSYDNRSTGEWVPYYWF